MIDITESQLADLHLRAWELGINAQDEDDPVSIAWKIISNELDEQIVVDHRDDSRYDPNGIARQVMVQVIGHRLQQEWEDEREAQARLRDLAASFQAKHVPIVKPQPAHPKVIEVGSGDAVLLVGSASMELDEFTEVAACLFSGLPDRQPGEIVAAAMIHPSFIDTVIIVRGARRG